MAVKPPPSNPPVGRAATQIPASRGPADVPAVTTPLIVPPSGITWLMFDTSWRFFTRITRAWSGVAEFFHHTDAYGELRLHGVKISR